MTGEDEYNPNVTIEDIRLAGHCVRGAGAWFKRHNLDFKEFIRNGLPAKTLIESGDSLAQRVVDRKKEREDGRRR